MMNRPNSTAATWLNYPVLVLATFTVATLFARSKARTPAEFMHPPTAQVVATVIGKELMNTPAGKIAGAPMPALSKALSEQTPTENKATSADTVLYAMVATMPSPAPKSPSRYMQYEGDKLFWVITPKTSFNDLALMKQEFERHGYKMKIQRLAYDPLDQYITDIKIAIVGPVVGVNDVEEMGVDGSPISSHGGYNGLRDINNEAAIGVKLPPELLQTLREEEASVATFIRTNRMKYLLIAGQKISTQYGTCSNTTNVDGLLARPGITQKYNITLSAEGTLAVADTRLPLFIDNKPVTNELLKRINVKMFNWVVLSEVCGPTGQPGIVKALLFYTKEP